MMRSKEYYKRTAQRLTPSERVFGAGMIRSMKSIDRMANSKWGERTVRTRKV